MIPPDVFLKATAAIFTTTFGLFILVGGWRRAPNFFLAAFLFLIAGNQGAEILRTLADGPAERLLWFRVATAFACLDPLLLFYFASVYPGRNALNRTWRVAVVASVGALLTLQVPSLPPSAVYGRFEVARIAYTGLVYSICLWHVCKVELAGHSEGRAWEMMAAFAIAAVPVWVHGAEIAVGKVVRLAPGAGLSIAAAFEILILVLAVITWVAIPIHSSAQLRARRRIFRSFALAAAVVSVSRFPPAYGLLATLVLEVPDTGPFASFGHAAAAVRWILFSALVSIAILQRRLLGMSLALRRRAARVLVALAVLGGAFGVFAFAGDALLARGVRPLDILLVGLVLAVAPGSRALVHRVAASIYGVPLPGDQKASIEVYRLAVAQVAAEGRVPQGDPELERLREELELDRRTADVLNRMEAAPKDGPLEPGRLFAGRYRIVRLLGRGASGRAFLATDELVRRDVVLKEVAGDDERGEAAALREARAAGALQHPNILTLHDVIPRRGGAVLVTEHAAGGSLQDRIEAGTPLQVDDVLDIVDGLLAGLEAVHAQGIVHRDLKPANVLLQPDLTPKIADFGIARVRSGLTVDFGAAVEGMEGTPDYMAPEVLAGQVATPAADIFAMGVLLRRAAPGRLPHDVEAVARKATAPMPGARWATAREMRKALMAARARIEGRV